MLLRRCGTLLCLFYRKFRVFGDFWAVPPPPNQRHVAALQPPHMWSAGIRPFMKRLQNRAKSCCRWHTQPRSSIMLSAFVPFRNLTKKVAPADLVALPEKPVWI